MELIPWSEEFRIGVPEIDYEHQELIRVINEACLAAHEAASRDAVSEFLGDVYARIAAHFALEEGIMRERGYDQYEEHKADHERLLDGICDIMDDFVAGAYGEDYEVALGEHLRGWFTDHFRTHDARLHRHFGGHPR